MILKLYTNILHNFCCEWLDIVDLTILLKTHRIIAEIVYSQIFTILHPVYYRIKSKIKCVNLILDFKNLKYFIKNSSVHSSIIKLNFIYDMEINNEYIQQTKQMFLIILPWVDVEVSISKKCKYSHKFLIYNYSLDPNNLTIIEYISRLRQKIIDLSKPIKLPKVIRNYYTGFDITNFRCKKPKYMNFLS